MTNTDDLDLVLSGGRVVDPGREVDVLGDLAMKDGRIAAIPSRETKAKQSLDVRGYVVCPGLVDIHGHYFVGGHPRGVDPDLSCLTTGVTTAADGGTCGWANFEAFRDFVIKPSKTRLLAFLHVSGAGQLVPLTSEQGELIDLSFAKTGETVGCARANPEFVVGIKVRIDEQSTGLANAIPGLELARTAARGAEIPLMVHVSGLPVPINEVLSRLSSGDIVTHAFHSGKNGIIGADGTVLSSVWAARERGVRFDVGYASIPGVHFDRKVAERALDCGFVPDTLSTDRHDPPADRVSPSLLYVMRTFLALGMSFSDVVATVTNQAASALGRSNNCGSLEIGRVADATVLKLGPPPAFELTCVMTVSGGQVVWRSQEFENRAFLSSQ